MIIQPKIRGFICTTAHPLGCAENVAQQINFAQQNPLTDAPKRVLIIGGSAGYGLSSRIISAYAGGAATLSVCYEREATVKKTASAGWYNNHAFEQQAHSDGLYAKSVQADAFTPQCKQQVAELIAADMGEIDLLVYSLAAPKRFNEEEQKWISSTLKPIGKNVSGRSIDTSNLKLVDYSVTEASQEEIDNTVYVMGGSDWQDWVSYLQAENLLSDGFKTTSFSYIGGELTEDIYRLATIGRAKQDLDERAQKINDSIASINGSAYISVLKAIVTQSSSAIPSFSLYISLLYKVMKQQGVHENCIEQINRLMQTGLYGEGCVQDKSYRLRLDERELHGDVQDAVRKLWDEVNADNLAELTDLEGLHRDFISLFGFGLETIDYQQDIELT
jgi:enoyl-[acyl-carrier protein] reductase/trans-2-enoyl-CoA reductase (NAD+)